MSDAKATARKAALAARRLAFDLGQGGAAERLAAALSPWQGRVLAGYMPIRTEIDPRPVMAAWSGPVVVPVIRAAGERLRFRTWHPGCAMEPGAFGALVPVSGEWIEPDVLIVPLVAWDRQGGRLGYGGGFYDRTLAALRAAGPVVAAGFAFAAQELPDLPGEPTDQPLDLLVTECETLRFS